MASHDETFAAIEAVIAILKKIPVGWELRAPGETGKLLIDHLGGIRNCSTFNVCRIANVGDSIGVCIEKECVRLWPNRAAMYFVETDIEAMVADLPKILEWAKQVRAAVQRLP